MNKTETMQWTDEEAKIKATINHYLAEIKSACERMKKTQREIDKFKAKTRATLDELKAAQAC